MFLILGIMSDFQLKFGHFWYYVMRSEFYLNLPFQLHHSSTSLQQGEGASVWVLPDEVRSSGSPLGLHWHLHWHQGRKGSLYSWLNVGVWLPLGLQRHQPGPDAEGALLLLPTWLHWHHPTGEWGGLHTPIQDAIPSPLITWPFVTHPGKVSRASHYTWMERGAGPSLCLCWWSWGHSFPLAFGKNGALVVQTLSLLTGCPFSSPLAGDGRLFLGLFWFVPVHTSGWPVLQLWGWDTRQKGNPWNSPPFPLGPEFLSGAPSPLYLQVCVVYAVYFYMCLAGRKGKNMSITSFWKQKSNGRLLDFQFLF